MSNPFNTGTKKIVREIWNTPILTYLHENYGFRFRYFGLPGVDLLDLKAWEPMIEEVVAFELPTQGENKRSNLIKLKENLENFGKPYDVFFGSMEHTVLNRSDFDGKPYKQDKFINLYNLDFCDELTSKVDTVDGSKKRLRYELIRQLLHDQHEIYSQNKASNVFILFITARNQTQSDSIRSLLDPDSLIKYTHEYFQGANKIVPIPTTSMKLIGSHAWALKAFLHDVVINRYFSNPHISTLNFPLLKYEGTPISKKISSPMVHWMILCKFENVERPRQNILPVDFLKMKSVKATEIGIIESPEPAETAPTYTDPLNLLLMHARQFFPLVEDLPAVNLMH